MQAALALKDAIPYDRRDTQRARLPFAEAAVSGARGGVVADSRLFREVLAAIGASAVALGGCGAGETPVKATEVPAAAPATGDAPVADAPPAAPTQEPAAASAPAPSAGPSAAPSAVPASLPAAKEMPKGNTTQKVRDSKRKKPCQAGCGEGTCGSPCG